MKWTSSHQLSNEGALDLIISEMNRPLIEGGGFGRGTVRSPNKEL